MTLSQRVTKTRIATRLLFSSFACAAMLAAVSPGCVTVNVNFPEATVQKASDDYVKDLYRAKEKGRASPEDGAPGAAGTKTSSWGSILIAEAVAAEIPSSFRMDSKEIAQIKGKQAERIGKIAAAAGAGQLGETNEGHLTLEHAGAASMKPILKKSLQPLVDAENKDREDLYEEVVKLNQMSKNRLIDVKKSFSRSFQGAAPAGTWVQDETGKWSQKK